MDSNSSTFFLLFKTCFSIPGFRPKQNSRHMFTGASSDHQSGPNLSIKVGQFTVSKWANSEYRNHTRLYRCLDRILPHKTKLEQHLKQRYGELFGAEFDVLLYDLTSTYVEGAAEKNLMMGRGYSRDHRPDCEQMVIALIVNSEGFPFSYETFDGNRADVSTMETILRMVERKYGKARRIWVF